MDARDITPRTGQEPADDSTDSSETADGAEPWIQESSEGYGNVEDTIIDGATEPAHNQGATFRLQALPVTHPDVVAVAVAAEHEGSKISAGAYLTPEQAEAFAEVLVDQAAEAREREEVWSG